MVMIVKKFQQALSTSYDLESSVQKYCRHVIDCVRHGAISTYVLSDCEDWVYDSSAVNKGPDRDWLDFLQESILPNHIQRFFIEGGGNVDQLPEALCDLSGKPFLFYVGYDQQNVARQVTVLIASDAQSFKVGEKTIFKSLAKAYFAYWLSVQDKKGSRFAYGSDLKRGATPTFFDPEI